MEAPIGDPPAKPRPATEGKVVASSVGLPTSAAAIPDAPGPSSVVRTVPLPSTIIGGAVAACGYVLGRLATGGPTVLAASLAVGVALLVAVAAAPVALRAGKRGVASGRDVAVIAGLLALTALVTAGAGALRAA